MGSARWDITVSGGKTERAGITYYGNFLTVVEFLEVVCLSWKSRSRSENTAKTSVDRGSFIRFLRTKVRTYWHGNSGQMVYHHLN
jgi:hypothetical protein